MTQTRLINTEDATYDLRPVLTPVPEPALSPVRMVLRVVRRHLILIGAMTIAVTAMGAWITFSLSKSYTASAVVAVREVATDPLASPDATAPRLEEAATDTAVVLLKSKDLAEQVIRQVDYEAGTPVTPAWRAELCQRVADWHVEFMADLCLPPAPRSLADRTDLLSAHLTVDPIGRSRAVSLSLAAPTGAMAVETLNTLITTEQKRERERQVAQMSQVAGWLESRSAELRSKWLQAEHQVGKFRVNNGLTQTSANGASQPLILQQLSNAATALSQSQADLASATARASSLQQAARGDKRGLVRMTEQPVIAAAAVALNALYSQQANLSQQFGHSYPALAAINRQIAQAESALGAQVDQSLRAVRTDLAEKQVQTDFLARSLDTLRHRANDMNAYEVEAATIEGEAKGAQLSYETFLSHAQQFADRSEIQQPTITLVSAARASLLPSFPTVPRFLFASVLMGLAAGVGAAFAREHLRTGFTEIGHIGPSLSLPLIATVPLVKWSSWRNRRATIGGYVVDEPTSQAAEAARTIAASIALAAADGTSQSVALTSAVTQEGKSVISLWLATVVAAAGHRVLVIDCDHRAGTITSSLRGKNGPGLRNLLQGSVNPDDVIQHDVKTGIHFIPSDLAAGIFSAQPDIDRLQAVLRELKQAYKLIILDTPPLLATSSALLYCSAADQAIFVCRWESTARGAVHASLARLRSARARLTGVVMSMVEPRNEVLYNTTLARRDQLMLKRYYGS